MLKKTFLIALLSVSIFFTACNDTKEENANNMISTNEFVLTSTDNKQFIIKKEAQGFKLEGAEGKVVILDIFATWCPPCRASASHLTSLQEKYKDDLVIIGITIEDGISNAKLLEFKKENDAQYTIVNSSVNRLLVTQIADALKLGENFPIPLMAMYKDGELITHYVGEVQEEFVQSDIERALGK